jgi:hypothetical protein
MMCGRIEIRHWSLIPDVVQLAFNRQLPAFLLPRGREDPYYLRECLTTLRGMRFSITESGHQFDFVMLLEQSHPFRASDPRDKVYSLLGLAADRDEIGLPVDYACTVEQLYTNVATVILQKSPDIEFLYNNLDKKSLSLPSWVPDWSTWRFGSHGTVARDRCYAASANTAAELRVSRDQLEVAGCLVSKIASLGGRIGYPYGRADESRVTERNAWLIEQREFLQQIEPYPGGMAIEEVLWRTLIGNITFYGEVAGKDYQAYYEAHVNYNSESSPTEKDMARQYIDNVRRRSRYRCLAITTMGYLGAVPQSAQVGDWVCMFHGGRHLFVVREIGANFTYLGPAYVQGLMNGEVLGLAECTEQTITLV